MRGRKKKSITGLVAVFYMYAFTKAFLKLVAKSIFGSPIRSTRWDEPTYLLPEEVFQLPPKPVVKKRVIQSHPNVSVVDLTTQGGFKFVGRDCSEHGGSGDEVEAFPPPQPGMTRVFIADAYGPAKSRYRRDSRDRSRSRSRSDSRSSSRSSSQSSTQSSNQERATAATIPPTTISTDSPGEPNPSRNVSGNRFKPRNTASDDDETYRVWHLERGGGRPFDMWDLQRLWIPPRVVGCVPMSSSPRRDSGSSRSGSEGSRRMANIVRFWPAFMVQTQVMRSATKPDGWRLQPLSQDRQLWVGWQLVEYFECFSNLEVRRGLGGGILVYIDFGVLPMKFLDEPVREESPRGRSPAIESDRDGNSDSRPATPDIEANDREKQKRARRRPNKSKKPNKVQQKKSRMKEEPPEPGSVRFFSPLKDHFLRLLHSSSSATTIPHGSCATTVGLVTLDLLRAVIECWIVHVGHLRAAIVRQVERRENNEIEGWTAAQGLEGAEWASREANLPRDLGLCLDFIFSKLLEDDDLGEAKVVPSEHQSSTEKLSADDGIQRKQSAIKHLRLVKLETEARLTAFRNTLTELTVLLDRQSLARSTRLQEQQQRSVTRLTLLAAVFLPISLASSLLSMSTRVADLGDLWYDYFGVSAVLVSVVIVVQIGIRLRYGFGRGWQMVWRNLAMAASQGQLNIGGFSFDVDGPNYERVLGTWFPTATALVLNRTKWWMLFRLAHLGLFLAVPVSFILGMFGDIAVGSRVLWISVVVWFGMVTVLMGLRMWYWLRMLKKSMRNDGRKKNKMTGKLWSELQSRLSEQKMRRNSNAEPSWQSMEAATGDDDGSHEGGYGTVGRVPAPSRGSAKSWPVRDTRHEEAVTDWHSR